MKRKGMALFVSAALAMTSLCTAGAAEAVTAAEETGGETGNAAGVTEELLSEIGEANLSDSILENHENFSVNVIFNEADGGVNSYYTYIDKDLYALEDSDSGIQIIKDGEIFGFDPAEVAPYRAVAMEGTFDNYCHEQRDSVIVGFEEGENVVSSEESEGMLTFVTALPYAAMEAAEMDVTGLAEDDVYMAEHTVDVGTLEMQSIHEWIQHADGTTTEDTEVKVTYDREPYEVPEELLSQLEDEDSRTVTIITDPGTDQEKEYIETVSKGCLVMFILAEGYDNLYMDPECTQVQGEQLDKESDVTMYAAAGK